MIYGEFTFSERYVYLFIYRLSPYAVYGYE